MPDPCDISAGILIGGKSTRMGTAKALLRWKGSTLVETVVQTARRLTDDCVLLGSAERLPESLADMQRLPDAFPGIGPIAGLHALLTHRPDTWCLLLSCDIPNVTPPAIRALVNHITPDTGIVAYAASSSSKDPTASIPSGAEVSVYGGGGNPPRDVLEPCCALYHAKVLPDIERAIAAGRYALRALISSVPHTKLNADPATMAALFNINTPRDYTDSP